MINRMDQVLRGWPSERKRGKEDKRESKKSQENALLKCQGYIGMTMWYESILAGEV